MNDLTQAAKQFLLTYFSDMEEHTPTNMEDDILGGLDVTFIFNGRPRWNRTPFFDALTELVDDNIVSFRQGDDGGYLYKLNQISN